MQRVANIISLNDKIEYRKCWVSVKSEINWTYNKHVMWLQLLLTIKYRCQINTEKTNGVNISVDSNWRPFDWRTKDLTTIEQRNTFFLYQKMKTTLYRRKVNVVSLKKIILLSRQFFFVIIFTYNCAEYQNQHIIYVLLCQFYLKPNILYI